jgi:2-desacetyl-2-hydroxyethyl bacteriochlorophyllide A dehydrogenase
LKAVICNAPFDLRLVEREEPVLGVGQVMMRTRRVGLCGTDFHIFAGAHPYLEYPRTMGHELAGEVIAVPDGSRFAIGQTVTINPYLACGACIACRRGKPNCCSSIKVLGVHIDGGMCELLVVPKGAVIDATGLTLDQAAMVEFLAIGAHAVARANLSEEDRVLVVGAGPIGIAAALFAKQTGAQVTLIDTRQARLDYARDRLGFERVELVDAGIAELLSARTGGDFFDCVFDATGNIAAMRAGLHYVAHGGSYVLIGVARDDLVFPDPEFHKRETTLIASRNALSADFDRVIRAIKQGSIPTAALQTHAFAAEDMPHQLPRLIEDADNVLKAIARF